MVHYTPKATGIKDRIPLKSETLPRGPTGEEPRGCSEIRPARYLRRSRWTRRL